MPPRKRSRVRAMCGLDHRDGPTTTEPYRHGPSLTEADVCGPPGRERACHILCGPSRHRVSTGPNSNPPTDSWVSDPALLLFRALSLTGYPQSQLPSVVYVKGGLDHVLTYNPIPIPILSSFFVAGSSSFTYLVISSSLVRAYK